MKSKLTVQCDTPGCGWNQDCDNPRKWLNVMCPQCGLCTIINDEDMRAYKIMQKTTRMLRVFDTVFRFLARLLGREDRLAFVHINSAPLRHGGRVKITQEEIKDE